MKKIYQEPNVLVFFPEKADVLTLSDGGSGSGMEVGWGESGI